MRSMQRLLKPANLLAAACRSETLHEALCIAQRSSRLSSALDECSNIRQISCGLKSSTTVARREFASNATAPQHQLFNESMDVSSPCKVTAVLHTPTHVHVAKGVMERLKVQVRCFLRPWQTHMSWVLKQYACASSLQVSPYAVPSNAYELCMGQVLCADARESTPESYILHRGTAGSIGEGVPCLLLTTNSPAIVVYQSTELQCI